MEREALTLALEALEEYADHEGKTRAADEAITAIKEALAQPEQPKVRTGDCLLVGVCASEGHKIQAKQEPWRESASDYERGVIDGRQMQAKSSVDKAVNRMAQPAQEPVCDKDPQGCWNVRCQLGKKCINTTPPKREWVGLTAEDFSAIKFPAEMRFPAEFRAGARWADTKLKEKNT